MKRKDSRYRASALPLVRRSDKPDGTRARKIFVIRQQRQLIRANAAEQKIQHLLIFDDHPDSLRLVLGRTTNPYDDDSASERAILWKLFLASFLTVGALIAMLWPIL